MANLGKLASLSKRMKAIKVNVTGNGQKEEEPDLSSDDLLDVGDDSSVAPPHAAPNAASPATAQPQVSAQHATLSAAVPMSGAVNVSVDLSPLRAVFAEIRDALHELTGEVRRSREAGVSVSFRGEAAEQIDALVRHAAASAHALQELVPALTSGGAGVAGKVVEIQEQLNLQQAQLAAILSKLTGGVSPQRQPAAPQPVAQQARPAQPAGATAGAAGASAVRRPLSAPQPAATGQIPVSQG